MALSAAQKSEKAEPEQASLISTAVQTEAITDANLRFSRWSLRFLNPAVEADYRSYRNARVARWLPILTVLVAAIVLLGVFLDLAIFAADEPTWPIIATRCLIAAGMLGAAAWLYFGERPRRLQIWIMLAVTLIHVAWLLATPAMLGHFNEYLGLLPVNMLMTFIVSGLMFQYACWLGLAAALAYAAMILSFYQGQPYGPIFYLMVLTLYAAYAAYIAERARREAWQLLQNVLPNSIATRMQQGERLIADEHEDACVLFADIVGFTSMSEKMEANQLVGLLNEIFSEFDRISDALDLEKIKTIGDCYMLVSGLPSTRRRDPRRIALAALEMQKTVERIGHREGADLKIRAGVHTGPVIAGVIGRRKFVYDLWGDTVNTASRLESSASPGSVHISATLRDELGPDFETASMGTLKLKGKAAGFEVWRLEGHKTGTRH